MEDFKENKKQKLAYIKGILIENIKSATRFDEKNLMNNLPLLFFVAALGIIHVANNHYLENKVRKINKLEAEIKELRWNYMTSKSNLMLKSKQSEVAEMVEELGLKELTAPPYIIEVKKNEFK
jgi:hypothetical protein